MKLVDSVRSAQASVSSAFDQLVSDIESDETAEGDTSPTVEKITVTYSDGSSADFVPPGTGGGVQDLTEEAPVEGEEKSDPTPPAAGDQEIPGNSEQV